MAPKCKKFLLLLFVKGTYYRCSLRIVWASFLSITSCICYLPMYMWQWSMLLMMNNKLTNFLVFNYCIIALKLRTTSTNINYKIKYNSLLVQWFPPALLDFKFKNWSKCLSYMLMKYPPTQSWQCYFHQVAMK